MVIRFDNLPPDAIAIAGGKGASLARMAGAGLPVPAGFVVCAPAFQAFSSSAGLEAVLERVTRGLNADDSRSLGDASRAIVDAIASAPIPPGLGSLIREAYAALNGEPAPAREAAGAGGRADAAAAAPLLVAVRSSAIAEDGAAASFAGQQESFLNVAEADLLARVRDCWASFFSPRALFYRAQKGSLADTRIAVVVQQMVRADKSGVLFTVDPIQKHFDTAIVEAVTGLGEQLVSGLVTPDHYKLSRDSGALRDLFVPQERAGTRVLSGRELEELWRMGLRLERHFGAPQDVEWCFDGAALLIVQSRPITTL